MSVSGDFLAAFDAAVDACELAAAQFDGGVHQAALGRLSEVGLLLPQASLDKPQLLHLRARLLRYRNLCGFLGDTLSQALRRASIADTNLYADQGQQVAGEARPLVERYG